MPGVRKTDKLTNVKVVIRVNQTNVKVFDINAYYQVLRKDGMNVEQQIKLFREEARLENLEYEATHFPTIAATRAYKAQVVILASYKEAFK